MDSLYLLTVKTMLSTARNLLSLLDKSVDHVIDNRLDEKEFMQTTLQEGGFSLAHQVNMASDSMRFCIMRITDSEGPETDQQQNELDDLIQTVKSVIAFAEGFKEKDFTSVDHDRKIYLPMFEENEHVSLETYVLEYALANFYFHSTTAFQIMLSQGLDITKRDFVNIMPKVVTSKWSA